MGNGKLMDTSVPEEGPSTPKMNPSIPEEGPSNPKKRSSVPTKETLFKKLGNFNPENNTTDMVCVDAFEGEYVALKLGNGGSWCRSDGKMGKKYKLVRVYADRTPLPTWSATPRESRAIQHDIRKEKFPKKGKKNRIQYIKLYGLQNQAYSRSIRKDIRNALKKGPCVSCGSKHNIEIDHKNGLNYPHLQKKSEQKISDFQPLCKHCNDQKRYTIVWTKKHKKRYPATKIPKLEIFGIDFVDVDGSETYDETDINAMVGTYWYDPIAFMEELRAILLSSHP